MGCIDILVEIYMGNLHTESNDIPIRRGVRQSDTALPKLFTTTLESIFLKLHWNVRGIPINAFKLPNP